MTILNVLLGIMAVGIFGYAALRMLAGGAMYVYNLILYVRIRRIKLDQMQAQAQLDKIRHLVPTEQGLTGSLLFPDGRVLNLEDLSVVTVDDIERLDPRTTKLWRVERLLRAGAGGTQAPVIEDGIASLPWPKEMPYDRLLERYVPALTPHTMPFGVQYSPTGDETPVIVDLDKMVHIMIGGGSGWGKSNMIYSLGRSLTACENCRIVLVDFAGTTLAPLMQAQNVLYPMATDMATARATFDALQAELQTRKDLFGNIPGIQNIDQYNKTVPEEDKLFRIYVLLDELPQLMRDKEMQETIILLVEQARKFGICFIGAGTTWHAHTVPEAARSNFACRVAFHCTKTTSQVVLDGQPDAVEIRDVGHALVQFPGVPDLVRVLTPKVDFAVVEGDGPLLALPPPSKPHRSGNGGPRLKKKSGLDAQVRRAIEQGHTEPTAVARFLKKPAGGGSFYRIRDALDRLLPEYMEAVDDEDVLDVEATEVT